jgi:hypothetical protein
VAPEEDVDGFFASWGLKTSEGSSVGESTGTSKSAASPSVEPAESANAAPTTSNSLWGSFTGSFFETGAKTDIDKQSTGRIIYSFVGLSSSFNVTLQEGRYYCQFFKLLPNIVT